MFLDAKRVGAGDQIHDMGMQNRLVGTAVLFHFGGMIIAIYSGGGRLVLRGGGYVCIITFSLTVLSLRV